MNELLRQVKRRPRWLLPCSANPHTLFAEETAYLTYLPRIEEYHQRDLSFTQIGTHYLLEALDGKIDDDKLSQTIGLATNNIVIAMDDFLVSIKRHCKSAYWLTGKEREQVVKAMIHVITESDSDAITIGKPQFLVKETGWNYSLLASVEREQDEAFAQRFRALGAEPSKHQMIVPRYHSWASVEPGYCLRLELDGAEAVYVPHYGNSFGDGLKQVTVYHQWETKAFAATAEAIRSAYGRRSSQAKELLGLLNYIAGEHRENNFQLRAIRNETCQRHLVRVIRHYLDRQGYEYHKTAIVDLVVCMNDESVVQACATQESTTIIEGNELLTAPFSERGRLQIRFDHEPTALLEGLYLQSLTPKGNWGRSHSRVDRISDLPAANQCALPDGAMILHGMTGVRNWHHAARRFQKMVETGGLISAAERRRRGLQSEKTMSPLGDIASGIDWGVPCTIGNRPSYGKWIVFGMKPSVFWRDRIWFAPDDFGAGQDRWPLYQQYAQSIGQGEIYLPPSLEARTNHLRAITKKHSPRNEIWFADSIEWTDIDTIFVCEEGDLFETVRELVTHAQAEGIIPLSLRVEKYTGAAKPTRAEEVTHPRTLVRAVVARAKVLQREERRERRNRLPFKRRVGEKIRSGRETALERTSVLLGIE